jgi:hypothetical protein
LTPAVVVRSALSRHYKEPVMACTSSFTEGSSVFGGQANLHHGDSFVLTTRPLLGNEIPHFEDGPPLILRRLLALQGDALEATGDRAGAAKVRARRAKVALPGDRYRGTNHATRGTSG